MSAAEQPLPGWSASEVDESELVSQDDIDAIAVPMKPYSAVRHQRDAVRVRTRNLVGKIRRS